MSTTLKEQFKEQIKKIKRDTGLTQDEIAKQLDYSRVYLSELMGKRGKVEQAHLDKLLNTTFTTSPNVVSRGVLDSQIPPQAWQNLTESILVLSQAQKKGQENISGLVGLLNDNTANSDGSLDTYSEDEMSALLQVLGRELAGKKVDSQGKFVAYAMKKLAEIRFGDAVGKSPKVPEATHPVAQG